MSGEQGDEGKGGTNDDGDDKTPKKKIPPPPAKPAGDVKGDDDGTDGPVTMTQKQLDNLDQKLQRKAAAKAEADLAAKFDGLSVDDVAALVAQKKADDDAQLSEAQKAKKDADDAAAKAKAAEAALVVKAFKLDLKDALLTPGEDPEAEPALPADRVAAVMPLALQAAEESDLTGEDAIAEAVAFCRETLPEVFSGSSEPPGKKKPPATPGTPGRTAKERGGATQPDDPGKAMLEHVKNRSARIGGDLPTIGQ